MLNFSGHSPPFLAYTSQVPSQVPSCSFPACRRSLKQMSRHKSLTSPGSNQPTPPSKHAIPCSSSLALSTDAQKTKTKTKTKAKPCKAWRPQIVVAQNTISKGLPQLNAWLGPTGRSSVSPCPPIWPTYARKNTSCRLCKFVKKKEKEEKERGRRTRRDRQDMTKQDKTITRSGICTTDMRVAPS